MGDSTNADNLEKRLIDFAVRVIKVAGKLPKTPVGKHIAGQLLRSGTSPAPNYAEARGAESSADFVHKLKISSQRTKRNKRLAQNGLPSGIDEDRTPHTTDR